MELRDEVDKSIFKIGDVQISLGQDSKGEPVIQLGGLEELLRKKAPELSSFVDKARGVLSKLGSEAEREKSAVGEKVTEDEEKLLFTGGQCDSCGGGLSQEIPISQTFLAKDEERDLEVRIAEAACPYCGIGGYVLKSLVSGRLSEEEEKPFPEGYQKEGKETVRPFPQEVVNHIPILENCRPDSFEKIGRRVDLLVYVDSNGNKMPMVIIDNLNNQPCRMAVPLDPLEESWEVLQNDGELSAIVENACLVEEDGPWNVETDSFGQVGIRFLGYKADGTATGGWSEVVKSRFPELSGDDQFWIFADIKDINAVTVSA